MPSGHAWAVLVALPGHRGHGRRRLALIVWKFKDGMFSKPQHIWLQRRDDQRRSKTIKRQDEKKVKKNQKKVILVFIFSCNIKILVYSNSIDSKKGDDHTKTRKGN